MRLVPDGSAHSAQKLAIPIVHKGQGLQHQSHHLFPPHEQAQCLGITTGVRTITSGKHSKPRIWEMASEMAAPAQLPLPDVVDVPRPILSDTIAEPTLIPSVDPNVAPSDPSEVGPPSSSADSTLPDTQPDPAFQNAIDEIVRQADMKMKVLDSIHQAMQAELNNMFDRHDDVMAAAKKAKESTTQKQTSS